jgi:hypothetical protein
MPAQPQIVAWRCHLCGNEFSVEHGGCCRSCGRATCGIVGEIDPRSCRQDRRHGNAKSASWKRMTIWNASRAGRQNDRRLLQTRSLPRAPDQVEFRLKLRQPLELHVLIASQVVDDVAALVETRDEPIELRSRDVDPLAARQPRGLANAPPRGSSGHEVTLIVVPRHLSVKPAARDTIGDMRCRKPRYLASARPRSTFVVND